MAPTRTTSTLPVGAQHADGSHQGAWGCMPRLTIGVGWPAHT
jgi:hypothetical protein